MISKSTQNILDHLFSTVETLIFDELNDADGKISSIKSRIRLILSDLKYDIETLFSKDDNSIGINVSGIKDKIAEIKKHADELEDDVVHPV